MATMATLATRLLQKTTSRKAPSTPLLNWTVSSLPSLKLQCTRTQPLFSLPTRVLSDMPSRTRFGTLSKLTLVGRTGREPTMREFPDGKKSFDVPVATNIIDADGDVDPQWHQVFVSDQVTGFSFLRDIPKGSLVYVQGDMRIITRDIDGQKRSFVTVRVSHKEGVIRLLATPRQTESESNAFPF